MNIVIRTRVQADLATVVAGFNEDLFRALAPPFPRVKVLRFDGCHAGDVVSVQLNFGVGTQVFTSDIIRHEQTDNAFVFVDRGRDMPFPLTQWEHVHSIERSDAGCVITDDITYRTSNKLLDVLTYPLFWLQFFYRKPIYRRAFREAP
jgi:ligand-binding SRPBCC domain-containing protein